VRTSCSRQTFTGHLALAGRRGCTIHAPAARPAGAYATATNPAAANVV
jgi:hypothetical protein